MSFLHRLLGVPEPPPPKFEPPSPTADPPIFDAIDRGDLATVRAMLNDNPELVFSKKTHALTTLHQTAERGNAEIVKLLLTRKADVHAKDQRGNTPLMLAAGTGAVEVVEMLLANKADIHAKGECGATALQYAALNRQASVVELLITHNAEYSLQDVVAVEDIKRVRALLTDNPAAANSRNCYDRSPLDNAPSRGIAELLLDHGAKINDRDWDGWTALHWAAVRHHADVVTLLLGRGAKVNAKTTKGETPLKLIEDHSSKDVAKLLRQHGGTT